MKNKLKIPLILSIIYVVSTFVLSIVGPMVYLRYQYKYWFVAVFILIVLCFLGMGYEIGIKSNSKRKQFTVDSGRRKSRPFGWKQVEKLIVFSVIVSAVSIMLEIVYLAGLGRLKFSLSSISDSYFTEIEGSSIILIFRFLTGFFRLVSNSLGVYYYRKLNNKWKCAVVINMVLIFFVTLFGYGQQKRIGDLFIYIAMAVLTNRAKSEKKLSKKGRNVVIVLAIGVLFLFAYIQSVRYASIGVTPYNYAMKSNGEIGYDTDNIVFKIFGDQIGFGLAVILSAYMSIGYYGLSLCLQLPFEWTYGIGSSRALTGLLEKIGITGIAERTYLSRMGEVFGRNGLASWNTIFPWLAGDITFIGIPIFFLFVGYIMAVSWKEIIYKDNAISYLMFTLICILILYIPANNQIFHSYESFISTWCVIIFWLFNRAKYDMQR